METLLDYVRLAGAGFVTVGAAAAYYFLQGPAALEFPVDFTQQSIILPGPEGARISCICEDQKLICTYFDDVRTIYDSFQRGLSISGDKPCLGWKPSPDKPYQWMTYKEVNVKATDFGAGLVNLGLPQKNDTRVGIYSQNRPEYVIADQAFYRNSFTGVPLYDTLGEEACNFIINQACLSTVICDSNAKVKILLNRLNNLPLLKILIVFEPVNEENKSLAAQLEVRLLHVDEVEKLGREKPVDAHPPRPEDLCMVCYTSGTTGTPKGAMLTHQNLISCISAALRVLNVCGVALNADDVLISYLPLAHSYERVIEAVVMMVGARIGFFQGDIKKLMDDIRELRPTLFPSVPRLLNRFYDKVTTGVNSSKIKKLLFSMALSSKSKELKRGVISNNTIWDKVVFRTVQAALGGRVRLITTGSAPISAPVLSFLRCIVGCPIVEGYGQTENSAVCTLTLPGDSDAGHVGPPLPCNMIKLVDVPEMGYYSNNNKGEVCLKGPNIFVGYLNDEAKTKEALDSDGWLHTGDVGEWLPNGTLKIIDRKKHIFKLSQGEYIAPEKIENVLIQSPWVAQIYVHGDSLQSCLVAIVVPDAETLPALTSKLGVSGSLAQLVENPEVKKNILKDLRDVGQRNGLSSLEQVKDIKLFPELFSVENGLLTPTFKTKRHELGTFFATDIANMYAGLENGLKS